MLQTVRRGFSGQWRTACHFVAPGYSWTFGELDTHALALANGLHQLGFAPGDKLLLALDDFRSPEIVTTVIACQKLGVTLVHGHSSLQQDLGQVKGSIFDHTLPASQATLIALLKRLVPELDATRNGQELNSSRFPSLKFLINAQHVSFRGCLKLKNIMTYSPATLFSEQPAASPAGLDCQSPLAAVGANHPFIAGVISHYYAQKKLLYLSPAAKLPFLQKSVPNIEVAAGQPDDLEGFNSCKVHLAGSQQHGHK